MMNVDFKSKSARSLAPGALCAPPMDQDSKKNSSEQINPLNNYVFERLIAKGSYSKVYIARNIHTKMVHAVKVCSKVELTVNQRDGEFRLDKEILSLLMNKHKPTAPFFIQLFEAFEDYDKEYLVQSWCPNGSLLDYIKKTGRLHCDLAKFYAAEILTALEHLHSLGIIHMALKTENILLDESMHIKITSFGSAEIVGKWETLEVNRHVKRQLRAFSESVHYITPEAIEIENLEISRTSDLWAFGSIIYEMISGVCPFQSIFSTSAKDLIQKLLTPDSSQRLGVKDKNIYTSIWSHPFFSGIEYGTLHHHTPLYIYKEILETSYQGEVNGESGFQVSKSLEYFVKEGKMKQLSNIRRNSPSAEPPVEKFKLGLSSLTSIEKERKMIEQRNSLPKWHSLCLGQLILKHGLLEKGKTLFAGKMLFPQKRMALLTLGPHLYLVNPTTETLIEEIPWGPELFVEHRDCKIFLIHTLNKLYYFRDTKNTALNWCVAIEEVHRNTY